MLSAIFWRVQNFDQWASMQGAYGIIIEVESHPFELDTMLFMDWRDDHTSGEMEEANR